MSVSKASAKRKQQWSESFRSKLPSWRFFKKIIIPVLIALYLGWNLHWTDGRANLASLFHVLSVPQHPLPWAYHLTTGFVSLNPLQYFPPSHLVDDDAIFVITGSSAGIGKAVAADLEQIIRRKMEWNLGESGAASRDASPAARMRIVHAVRSPKKITEPGARVIELDLASLASVQKAANKIEKFVRSLVAQDTSLVAASSSSSYAVTK